jgi:hypothetical protein
MQEQTSTPALGSELPGPPEPFTMSMRRPESLQAATPLQQFLDRVVCDGRFLDTVIQDPRAVADTLGIELSPETEAQVKEKSLNAHWADFYANGYGMMPIGIMIGIVGVCILLGIVVVVAWKYTHKAAGMMPVRDVSPHALAKL